MNHESALPTAVAVKADNRSRLDARPPFRRASEVSGVFELTVTGRRLR